MINITKRLLLQYKACEPQADLFGELFPRGFPSNNIDGIMTSIANGLDVSWFAYHVMGERWVEAEPFIATNAELSLIYAMNIIKDRWILGERNIDDSPFHANKYAKFLIDIVGLTDFETLPDNIKSQCLDYLESREL
jgi:hypothetical protein